MCPRGLRTLANNCRPFGTLRWSSFLQDVGRGKLCRDRLRPEGTRLDFGDIVYSTDMASRRDTIGFLGQGRPKAELSECHAFLASKDIAEISQAAETG
jgi:hypothetical protein